MRVIENCSQEVVAEPTHFDKGNISRCRSNTAKNMEYHINLHVWRVYVFFPWFTKSVFYEIQHLYSFVKS